MEYVIYCDESIEKGPKFGDFFGGCIVNYRGFDAITRALDEKKAELNLRGELKWTKVTEQYLEKYIAFIHFFFDFVRDGRVKMRIFFRDIRDKQREESHVKADKFFKLYYQFIKNAFGLKTTVFPDPCCLRIYLDTLPDRIDRCSTFKRFLQQMPDTRAFANPTVHIRQDQIAEVRSHDHVLLQGVDIVLGAMQFKLNGFNLATLPGSRRRGKRTIAKEKLYCHILREICTIHPRFNIGVSTGSRGYENPHWNSPYEHWKFCSSSE